VTLFGKQSLNHVCFQGEFGIKTNFLYLEKNFSLVQFSEYPVKLQFRCSFARMNLQAIKLILLFALAAAVVAIPECNKDARVSIRLAGTKPGQQKRHWELDKTVDTAKCHEIGKKMKYDTSCNYGSKSKICVCSGTWTSDAGVLKRMSDASTVTEHRLEECSM